MDLLDKLSGEFEVTHIRDKKIINQFKVKNLITNEGKRHLLRLAFDWLAKYYINGSLYVTFADGNYTSSSYYPLNLYLGLIGADITPSATDTLSQALGASGTYNEFTSYTATQTNNDNTRRPILYLQVQNAQSTFVTNANNTITFTFTNTTPATIYGFFTTTIRQKGANSNSAHNAYGQFHCLFSAVRFTSPVQVVNNDQLAVIYKISL